MKEAELKDKKRKDKLWEYGKVGAILTIPLVWILFAILFSLTHYIAGWPAQGSEKLLIILAIIVSLIPLGLVLLDFFASKGAVLDVKGFKLDFSKINLDKPEIKRESIGLPDNIGVKAPIMTDTAVMKIIEALKQSTQHELVVINIGKGNSWWVTRLLALAAGAVRAGSPKAFVFAGKKDNIPNRFLGWGKPEDILQAILDDKEQYRIRYEKALKIAKQAILFSDQDLRPTSIALAPEVNRIISNTEFTELGEAVTEQIIMDQLTLTYGYDNSGSLENPPDKLTLARCQQLFGSCLNQEVIDLSWPNEQQIEKLLQAKLPYIPLVRDGIYDSMLKREDGERLILQELYKQLSNKKEDTATA